jgi:prolyl-tRNA editing enzyme YbaK/EbsC (Cys-tRNA(Pro) deacylase)
MLKGCMNNVLKSKLKVYKLDKEVVTCEEAAVAKGIPLKNELKTLIIQTSDGLYALHLPGNRQASLRAVKNFLNVDESYLLDEDELGELHLMPGTVSPMVDIVWNLPHLVSQEVLNRNFVSTNDGTRSGYVIFKPQILLSAMNVKIGKFSRSLSRSK